MTRTLLDAHLHTFDLARYPQPWIEPGPMAAINRDFTVAQAALADRDVIGAVVVQTLNSAAETLSFLAAAAAPETHGVVGWLDLTADVPAQLDRLRAAPGGGKLVGIRHLAHIEEDERWLLRSDVVRGLAALAAAGLPFDLVIRSWQLDVALALAGRLPELSLVLDHLGNPPADRVELGEWVVALSALAAHGSVSAKISGIADRDGDTRRRVVDVALDVFGPQRLMFGSDWPLVQLAGGYTDWQQRYLALTASLTPAEQAAIDQNTARRSYRTLS